MLIWIQISLSIFLIFLSISLFLVSFFYSKKIKNTSIFLSLEIERKISEGVMVLKHNVDLVDDHIQDISMDIRDLSIRTNIVETRLEERYTAFLLSSSIAPKPLISSQSKRGRPRKNPEEE